MLVVACLRRMLVAIFVLTTLPIAPNNAAVQSNTVGNIPRTIPSCLLRCKDEHMTKMDGEWSLDFALPLLALIRDNRPKEVVRHRMMDICRYNSEMNKCLYKCPATTERTILQLGLEPWREMCSSFDVLLAELNCWKRNVDALMLACHLESHRLRDSMGLMTTNTSSAVIGRVCEALTTLASCSIDEYGRHCGEETRELLVNLFRHNQESTIKMLKIRWNELPAQCTKQLDLHGRGPQPTGLVERLFSLSSSAAFARGGHLEDWLPILLAYITTIISATIHTTIVTSCTIYR